MSRRRLRVVCSSEEEDEDFPPPPPPPPPLRQPPQDEEIDDLIIDDIETDFQTVTLNSGNPTPSTNNSTTNTNRHGNRHVEPIPLDISDEDEENVITSDPTNNPISGSPSGNSSYFEVSESQVHGELERRGVRLRREWLDSCLLGLQLSVQGFEGMDDSAKANLCFAQFLWSDMNFCGAGVLPPNVSALHLVDLKGPFVLQVDEIVNISTHIRGRYQNAAPGSKRCLKLSMTDGIQRVVGMEYRPIKDLEVLAPAGVKVAVFNVNIRHGLLMLVPEVIEILGGNVKELEAARQRLVNEVNKPPRGRRTRTGVVPPLATRATLAAWTPCNDTVPGHAGRNPPAIRIPLQASGQESAVSFPASDMHRQDFATSFSRNNAETNTSAASKPQEQDEVPRHTNMPTGTHSRQGPDRPRKDFEVPMSGRNPEPSTLSAMQPVECANVPLYIDEPSTEVMTSSGGTREVNLPGIPANNMPGEDVRAPDSRDNAEPNTSPIHIDVEEISMVDELENNFILCTDKEIPFTYLASLSAKCVANDDETSVVRGKIKCFLTGVKGFQYKQRTTYELRVYVDDGSLISEILIEHDVVQKGIGYSPQEVTSALASSESKRVSEMKETLKQFQIFLVNFEKKVRMRMFMGPIGEEGDPLELGSSSARQAQFISNVLPSSGTMVVEMSKASSVPVAVEMNQGCPAYDAWLLLKRVKSLSYAQPQNLSHPSPIGLSTQPNGVYRAPCAL